MSLDKRLLVISNRLPFLVEKKEEGWSVKRGSGGLVTALSPVMERNNSVWIGWPGCDETVPFREILEDFNQSHPYRLEPVALTAEQVEMYYRGFSNETIWPLFHDLLGYSKFKMQDWIAYNEVNSLFAEAVKRVLEPGDFIWVHDYQLMMVGQRLRQMGVQQKLAYFLHIPFPSLDLFRRLPWKREVINALLEYDLLGFQTLRDRRNFVLSVKGMIPDVQVEIRRRNTLIRYNGREIKVGHYPISIDFKQFNHGAKGKEAADAAWYLHENIRVPQIILGIDRLDYTKGIPERFRAYERALEKYPDLRGRTALLQVVIPSRTHVPDYQNLKETLDRLTGRINGRFSKHGWIPLHYLYRSLDHDQLYGYYRACDIALVTPLRDGMNLVAKEYCASNIDAKGVLILSEFAGAADQMSKGALMVNPYDQEATADAIHQAFCMSEEERRKRMRTLRAVVRRNDVHRWVEWFLEALFAGNGPEGEEIPLRTESAVPDEITPYIDSESSFSKNEEGEE